MHTRKNNSTTLHPFRLEVRPKSLIKASLFFPAQNNNAQLQQPMLPTNPTNPSNPIITNPTPNPVGRPAQPNAQPNTQNTQMPGQVSLGIASNQQPKGFGNTPISNKSTNTTSSATKTAISKYAILGTALGATAGLLSAPKGRRREGLSRGMARGGGVDFGASLGGLSGGLGGAGLGLLLSKLIPPSAIPSDENIQGLGASLGGLLGGAAGAGYGGYKGYKTINDYIGPASYDKANTKPDKGLGKEDKEHTKKAIISTMLHGNLVGAAADHAKSYSDKEDHKTRINNALYGAARGGPTAISGLAGTLIGGLLGAGSGAGLGLLGNKLIPGTDTSPSNALYLPGSLGLLGASAGSGLGGYYGGKAGLKIMDKILPHKNKKESSSAELKSRA